MRPSSPPSSQANAPCRRGRHVGGHRAAGLDAQERAPDRVADPERALGIEGDAVGDRRAEVGELPPPGERAVGVDVELGDPVRRRLGDQQRRSRPGSTRSRWGSAGRRPPSAPPRPVPPGRASRAPVRPRRAGRSRSGRRRRGRGGRRSCRCTARRSPRSGRRRRSSSSRSRRSSCRALMSSTSSSPSGVQPRPPGPPGTATTVRTVAGLPRRRSPAQRASRRATARRRASAGTRGRRGPRRAAAMGWSRVILRRRSVSRCGFGQKSILLCRPGVDVSWRHDGGGRRWFDGGGKPDSSSRRRACHGDGRVRRRRR